MSGGLNSVHGFLSNPVSFGANLSSYYGGTTLTAPTANNTKGAWLQVGSNTTYDTTDVLLSIYMISQGGTETSFAIDMGYGPSGSQQVVIGNLNFNFAYSGSYNAIDGLQLFLPLQIPANNAVWFRYAADSAAPTSALQVSFITYDSSFQDRASVQKFDTIGTTATGRGNSVNLPVGGVKGSNVLIGTANNNYNGFFIKTDLSGYTSDLGAVDLDISIGNSTVQTIIYNDLYLYVTSYNTGTSPYFSCFIPQGTNIYVRGTVDGVGTAANCGITFYGGH